MNADTSPELHDRRQRAREAYWDAVPAVADVKVSAAAPYGVSVEAAIETASRVRIDKTVMQAAWNEYLKGGSIEGADDPDLYDMLYVAFEAAGFEVEN